MQARIFQGRSYLWVMVLVLFLLTLLGSFGLKQVLWDDEIKSLYRAGNTVYGGAISPIEIWQRTAEVYNQVPGYYMVLAAWGSVAGLSNVAGRYLSLLLGLLAVAWTYRLGRDLHSRLAGLATAVVLISSAFFVNYLHDLRTYTLLVLLTAIGMWLYWRIAVRRQNGWLLRIALTLCITGLLYSHYFSITLIGALCLYHLLFVAKDRLWWIVTGLIAAAGVLFLPWFLNYFTAAQTSSPPGTLSILAAATGLLQDVFNGFSSANIALWIICALMAWKLRGHPVRFLWFLLATALLLAIGISWYVGFFEDRYLIELWVPLALLAGLGIVKLKQLGVQPAILLGAWLLIGMAYNFDPAFIESLNPPSKFLPWDVLARTLDGRAQDGDVLAFADVVVTWDGAQPSVMDYYFPNTPLKLALVESLPNMIDADFLHRADEALNGAKRVWESYAPDQRPYRAGMLENYFTEKGLVSCGVISDTPDLFLQLYTRPTQDSTARFATATVGDTVDMNLVELLPRAADKSLYITVDWDLGSSVPANTYSVGQYVLDATGKLVAQKDYGLPTSSFACSASQIDLSQLPPGKYKVESRIYNWQTGAKMLAQTKSSSTPTDTLVLGSFQLS